MVVPKLHYISQGNTPKEHLENIQKACSSGAELVQLRLKNISEKKYLKFATEAREITAHFQTRLLVNEHFKVAKTIKADGIHLDTVDFSTANVLENLYTWQIVGATANTLQDCKTLLSKKVDYIRLGPFKNIKETNIIALGLNGYTTIVEALKTETPMIGFGGITTEDVTAILETGVSGVAVSEEITQNFDVIKTYNQLLKTAVIDEQRHRF